MKKGQIPYIDHPQAAQARTSIQNALASGDIGKIVLIVGLSGCGKTTVRDQVLRDLYGSRQHWVGGQIPVANVMALNTRNGFYDFKGTAIAAHKELLYPDVSWIHGSGANRSLAKELECDSLDLLRSAPPLASPRASEGVYWQAFVHLARTRECRTLCIENASVMMANHRDGSPATHLLGMMSVAEKARINTVLSMTHVGFDLWTNYEEIRRRSVLVLFKPYDLRVRAEELLAISLLKKIASNFLFENENVLRERGAELLSANICNCGEIVAHLERARLCALSSGRTRIGTGDIDDTFPGALVIRDSHDKYISYLEAINEHASSEGLRQARAGFSILKRKQVETQKVPLDAT